jgi:hypothetical protein
LETIHGLAAKNAVKAHHNHTLFSLASREQNETMDTYLTHYKTLYNKSGSTLTNQQLTIHYLLSLQYKSFQQIILTIGEGEKEPWYIYSLEATHHKAAAHLALF